MTTTGLAGASVDGQAAASGHGPTAHGDAHPLGAPYAPSRRRGAGSLTSQPPGFLRLEARGAMWRRSSRTRCRYVLGGQSQPWRLLGVRLKLGPPLMGTEVPFHSGFLSMTGLNGIGKSLTVEALGSALAGQLPDRGRWHLLFDRDDSPLRDDGFGWQRLLDAALLPYAGNGSSPESAAAHLLEEMLQSAEVSPPNSAQLDAIVRQRRIGR